MSSKVDRALQRLKVMTKRIKTLIIADPSGGAGMEPEEEADFIARYLAEMHGLVIDYTITTGAQTLDEAKPDLVILDYGGAMIGYGDTAYSQVKYVLKWAEEHPSKLVLIYTFFTTWMVHEIQEDIDPLDNVLFWDPLDKYRRSLPWEEKDIYQAELALKIRHWYGILELENMENNGEGKT